MRLAARADNHHAYAEPIRPDGCGQKHARQISHARRSQRCARPAIAPGSFDPKEKICKRNRMLLESPLPAGARAVAGLQGSLRADAMRRHRSRPHEAVLMQLSILPAGAQSIADDPPALRALYLAFGVLLAILPLAHVTALRNVLVGLIVGLALLHFRLAPWKNVAGLMPWLIWLAFAAASIGWSALPDASFQSFRSDQFYPFAIFLVSFLVVRFLGGRLAIAIGTAAGTLLCLTTMFAATMLGVDPDATAPDPGLMGWLAWKAGTVPDSSTYVAFIAAPLFLILVTSRHTWRRSA